MKFEHDPGKNEINQGKHGLSFEQAEGLWSVPGVEFDLGIVNGEMRYARLGLLAEVVTIAIFTYRHGPAIRLISARAANELETQKYEQARKK